MTEPYAAVLADGMTEGVLAETEAIKRRANAEDAPDGTVLCLRSYYERMTGSSGRRANPEMALDRLLDALMESSGREARRKAAEAIRRP